MLRWFLVAFSESQPSIFFVNLRTKASLSTLGSRAPWGVEMFPWWTSREWQGVASSFPISKVWLIWDQSPLGLVTGILREKSIPSDIFPGTWTPGSPKKLRQPGKGKVIIWSKYRPMTLEFQDVSYEKKGLWLLRVYGGLYYTVKWWLFHEPLIRIPVLKQPVCHGK